MQVSGAITLPLLGVWNQVAAVSCFACVVPKKKRPCQSPFLVVPNLCHISIQPYRANRTLTMTTTYTVICYLALGTLFVTDAFSTQSCHRGKSSSTELKVSRRDILASSVVTGLSVLTGAVSSAHAKNEVDFDKVQDLLGSSYQQGSMNAQVYGEPTSKRPTFLTDPTDEFKQSEQKAAEFKRAQLKAKKEFQEALDKLQTDPNDGAMLAKDLDQVRYLVQKNVGLPEGISKKDVITQVRRRKAKKFWPTEVEIAYQDLLYEIMKKQSPNTDRDPDFV